MFNDSENSKIESVLHSTSKVPSKISINVKFDSGATSNYLRPQDAFVLDNIEPHQGPLVTLPDENTISPSHQGELPLPSSLSKTARTATVLPKLQSSSLLATAKLCDDDNLVIFDKDNVKTIPYNKKVVDLIDQQPLILKGHRNQRDRLWETTLTPDISRFKQKMDTNHFIMPPTHANIYPKRCVNDSTTKIVSFATSRNKSKAKIEQTSTTDNFDLVLDQQRQEDLQKHAVVQLLTPQLNIVLRKDEKQADLATFLHAACFSPVPSTFIKAIDNGHFSTWPGLTTKLIKTHLPKSMATEKGHLKQERQRLQSTSKSSLNYDDYIQQIKKNIANLKKNLPANTTIQQALEADILADAFPSSDEPNIKTKEVAYSLVDIDREISYMDLTGRFPYKSSRGYEYLLVGYNYDSNAILVQPLKNREATSITEAWKALHARFGQAGYTPATYLLDNEFSNDLKTAFAKENVKYQLDKPHLHRANAAERAIQTFKAHFKAGLASLDPAFPVREWDRLLVQAEITLNMLRSSRVNPKMSAYTAIWGEFDYNKTPIVPPGTKVLAHTKPSNRTSWGVNGEEGWTIGPSPDHYRCINCYFPKTRSQRHVDTVTSFPVTVPFPKLSIEDFLKQAAQDIVTILKDPPSTTTLSLKVGDEMNNALVHLAEILNRTKSLPAPHNITSEVLSKSPRVQNNEDQKKHIDKHPTQQVRNLRRRNVLQPIPLYH